MNKDAETNIIINVCILILSISSVLIWIQLPKLQNVTYWMIFCNYVVLVASFQLILSTISLLFNMITCLMVDPSMHYELFERKTAWNSVMICLIAVGWLGIQHLYHPEIL